MTHLQPLGYTVLMVAALSCAACSGASVDRGGETDPKTDSPGAPEVEARALDPEIGSHKAYAAELELVGNDGARYPVLHWQAPCDSSETPPASGAGCVREPVVLQSPVDDGRLVGLLDLRGPQTWWGYGRRSHEPLGPALPSPAKMPAALIWTRRARDGGGSTSYAHLVLLDEERSGADAALPRIVWTYDIERERADGSGVSPINSLGFVRDDEAEPDAPLVIVYESVWVPRDDDPTPSEGPPELERFAWDGVRYEFEM